MMFKTIEQERAEAEAMVKGMDVIGSIRRIECSGYISPWDDPDMDTTETLYQDKKGAYYLRVEQCHDFMDADDVWHITRKEAESWIRENVRNIWTARKNHSRIIRKMIRKKH